MVYLYKKIVGKKPYYYLRASKRKGKKVIVKDLAYLGSSTEEVRKKLDDLSQYKNQIRKAYKTINNFLESDYYYGKIKELKLKKDELLGEKLFEVEACKYHFIKKFQKEHNLTKKEVFKSFLIEFAFNTTSIEGNTINLEEARKLLEEGLTPKDKTLRDIYDLQNTEKVFFDLLGSKKQITHKLIIDIHKGLLENTDDRFGYRKTNIRVFRSRFKSSPAQYILTDMDLLLKWYNKSKNKLHPLVLAAIFHHQFEKIHPFMNGNGRVGRMLVNYILINKSYPPAIIKNKFRDEYLDCLGKADEIPLMEVKKENYFDLVQFIADAMTSNYWDIFLI